MLNQTAVKTIFVAFLVGVVHLVAGIGVLIQPTALLVTPFASLVQITVWLGTPTQAAGTVMVLAGAMAIFAASRWRALNGWQAILMFLPQQLLLMLQLMSITMALVEGHYPDGYVPAGGAWFILTDQMWAWVLAISHSLWLAVALVLHGEESYGGH